MRPNFSGNPDDTPGMVIQADGTVPPDLGDLPGGVPSDLGASIQGTVQDLIAFVDDLVETAAAEVSEMMPPSFAGDSTNAPGMGLPDDLGLPPDPADVPPVVSAGPVLVDTPGDVVASGMMDGLNVDLWFA